MIVDLENFYAEYESSICATIVTPHIIQSGTTNRSVGLSFEILNYNESTPPHGNITIWADFATQTHPYELILYKSVLDYFENGSYVFQTGLLKSRYPTSKLDSFKSINISFIMIILVFFYTRKKRMIH